MRLALLPLLVLAACASDPAAPTADASREATAAETAAPPAEPVVRGDSLLIPYDGGTVALVNNPAFGEETVSYEFIAYDAGLQGYLVRAAYWEGGALIHVSPRSGRQTTLHGDIVPSPDGRYFATASSDLLAGNAPNRIAIYRIAPDGPALEWEAESGWDDAEPWGPEMAEWLDADRLRFRRVAGDMGEPDGRGDFTEVTVTRRAPGTWQPDANL